MRRAGPALLCLALAACQTSAPTPSRSGLSDAAHALHTRLTEAVKTCWFSGDPAFAGYVYTPEVNAGAPRILVVSRDNREGRPLLVIEATGAASANVYGPLLTAAAGPRARSDLDRWIAGGSGCTA